MLTEPQWLGLENYRQILIQDELFWKALINTIYYTFVSVPLQMVGGLIIALLLNRNWRGIGWFRGIFYLPQIVAGVAFSILWMWILHPHYGLLNYILGKFGIRPIPWFLSKTWAMPTLILISLWGLGDKMLIYLAGLKGIPAYLYEAAEIDGATPWSKFVSITLPMLSPSLFFTLVMGIIWSFQVFTASYIITGGGPDNATLVYVLYLYRTAFQQFRMGYASALAWIFLVIILCFTSLIFKSSPLWVYYEGELKRR